MLHVYLTVFASGHVTSMHSLFRRMLELEPDLRIISISHVLVKGAIEGITSHWPEELRQRLDLRLFGEMDNPFGTAPMMFNGLLEVLEEVKAEDLRVVGLDQFGTFDLLPRVRELAGPKVKVLMTWTGSATCVWSFMVPFKDGGIADISERANELAKDDGDAHEIAIKLTFAKNGYTEFKGLVLKTPGFPKGLYDYERESNNAPNMPNTHPEMIKMVHLARDTDGILNPGSEVLEPAAIEAYKKIKDVYAVGLQTHEHYWHRTAKLAQGTLLSFLDKQENESVIYVAFGSFIAPHTTPHLIGILVKTLIALGMPFVLNAQSDLQKKSIPPEAMEAVEKHEKAFVATSWIDQGALLCHPSISFFMSHCGMNSVTESLATGVPIIAWPMANDELAMAALLSTRDKPLAFELLQIRQGPAQAKPMRGDIKITGKEEDIAKEMRDVLTATRGAAGAELRRNVRDTREALMQEQQGRAKEQIRRLTRV